MVNNPAVRRDDDYYEERSSDESIIAKYTYWKNDFSLQARVDKANNVRHLI